jgi:ankyrin repeat protein
VDDYKEWAQRDGSSILYINAGDDSNRAAREVFYNLEGPVDLERPTSDIVLHFVFAKCDVRRNSIRDMMANLLAHIACKRSSSWVDDLYTLLDYDTGHTEEDTLQWFNYFRKWNNGGKLSLVLQNFDECRETSRKSFLDMFSRLSEESESLIRVIVTSREAGALSSELSEYACVTTVAPEVVTPELDPMKYLENPVEVEVKRFSRSWPEITHFYGAHSEVINDALSDLEPLARSIIWCQVWANCAFGESSIELILRLAGSKEERRPTEVVVDEVLRNASQQETVQKLIRWLLYGVRPLTAREIATVLWIGTNTDDGTSIGPSEAELKEILSKIKTMLAGIVGFSCGELHFLKPQLRGILMKSNDSSYFWTQTMESAHYEITSTCLDYLSRKSVQDELRRAFPSPSPAASQTYSIPEESYLCAYVGRAWPHHLSFILKARDEATLMTRLQDPVIMECAGRAYWSLVDPSKRGGEPIESTFQLFAALGLENLATPEYENDLTLGLQQAARWGRMSTVMNLLGMAKYSTDTLLRAFFCAGKSAHKEMALTLLDAISGRVTSDWEIVKRMSTMLPRVVALGFDDLLEEMMNLGCQLDVPFIGRPLEPVLHTAARCSLISTARILMKHGANLQTAYRNLQTPLHIAACVGNAEMVTFLATEVKHDSAILDKKDTLGFTPLHLAVSWGNFKSAQELMRLGANKDISSEISGGKRHTALLTAIEVGHMKCLRSMTEAGVVMDIHRTHFVQSPLQTAIKCVSPQQCLKICRFLLEHGANPNDSSISPPILLQLARMENSQIKLQLIELFFEYGVLVDSSHFLFVKEYPSRIPLPPGNAASMKVVNGNASTSREYDDEIIKCLLRHGANINAKDRLEMTALHHAVQNADLSRIKLLLENGADPNAQDDDLRSPLNIGPLICVSELLAAGADPNSQDLNGFTPLMTAARWRDKNGVRVLLRSGADLQARMGMKKKRKAAWTAIHFALVNGHRGIVRMLVEAGFDLGQGAFDSGDTLLHFAVKNRGIKILLEFGKKVDVDQVNELGNTALHEFDYHETSKTLSRVKTIVQAGADLSIQNNDGDTPLILAAEAGNTSVVEYFLSQSSGILDISSPARGTALHRACHNSHLDVVKVLVGHGANINAVCKDLGTPIYAACLSSEEDDDSDSGSDISSYVQDNDLDDESTELVQYLLEQGADPNIRGGELSYAISFACFRGSTQVLDLLLSHGAEINVGDEIGRLPVHFASLSGKLETIIDAGGEVNALDKLGRSPLHWAAASGNLISMEVLLSHLPPEAIDQPDIDGWTPLCWASRRPISWLHSRKDLDHAGAIRFLIQSGADRLRSFKFGGEDWTPLRIAQYSGVEANVVRLLKHGIRDQGTADVGDDNEDTTSQNLEDCELEMQWRARRTEAICFGCLWVSPLT